LRKAPDILALYETACLRVAHTVTIDRCELIVK